MENSIAIVTDSTADIPADLAEKFHIHVVPNVMVINGQSLEDGKGITRQAFYELLPALATPPTTATASSGTYETLYECLLNEGAAHVISIHASSVLSGIINAANAAANMFHDHVRVVDSLQITLGLGFQVLAAAEAAAAGKSLQAVLDLLANLRPRARVVAMLDTLEYVRRSGRVSWTKARLGNLLHLKPFIEIREGHVISLGEARTRHKGIERLKQLLYDQGPLERLAILHTNAENEARQFLAEITPQVVTPPLFVNVTTVIGTHTGPKALGFAGIVQD
jgi:DegV family protein with EDD domain